MNILVTGGASGLGRTIVKSFAVRGSDAVTFTYCRSKDKAEELEKEYSNVRSFFCDFTNSGSVNDLVSKLEAIDPDILVNNALTGMIKNHFHKIDPSEFEKSFAVNVLPVIKITCEAIKIFRKKKSGKIINILSTAIIDTPPIGWAEYTANKNYLLSLSKSWAAENAKYNITSNCISPSFLMTELNKDVDERTIEELKNGSPTGNLLTVEEVAAAVCSLANASGDVNGTNIILNPGINAI